MISRPRSTLHGVFVTGGTGYLGRPLIGRLLARGHSVRALVRAGFRTELPEGAEPVVGDALRPETFRTAVSPSDTLVHLVGTPRPSPAKAAAFRSVDLVSVRASLSAALETGVRHFVYVSVAHPAPVMRAYIAVRSEAESLIRASGLATTLLRPWYVLGPGRRWPWLLLPLYTMLRLVPSTRAAVRRLGLVSRSQMVGALVDAVENPPVGVRVVEVPEIRSFGG